MCKKIKLYFHLYVDVHKLFLTTIKSINYQNKCLAYNTNFYTLFKYIYILNLKKIACHIHTF